MSRIRWILVPAIPILAAAFVILRHKSDSISTKAGSIVTVARGTLRTTVVDLGYLEPKYQTQIRSRVGGIVSGVSVDAGDVVKRGQPLFQIDSSDYARDVQSLHAEIMEQRAALRLAKQTRLRSRKAVRLRVAPYVELDRSAADTALAAARLERAKIAYAVAKDRLLATTIRAPFDGTVIQRNVNPGEVVVPGITATAESRPLLVLADLRVLILRVDLNQMDIVRVRVGQGARARFDAYPDVAFDAQVTRVAAGAVTGTAGAEVFPVELTLEPNQNVSAIKLGMTAEATIEAREIRNVLLIPIEAVATTDGDQFVEVVVGRSPLRTQRRQIRIGDRSDRDVMVREGLREHETVLIATARQKS